MNGPLGRIVFPLFVLTMWVLLGVWLAQGDWTGLNWLMLGTAAVCCAIVFVDFVSVFNFGYASCMILLPIEVLIVRGFEPATVLLGGLSIIYGVRLFEFAWRRRRQASFAGQLRGMKAADSAVPTPVKAVLFLFVTTLQTFEGMSVYVVGTEGVATTWLYVGAALMAVGLILEWVADEQKTKAKAAAPTAFVRNGLYARTRHPNYTGEIVFQIGLAIAAFGSVTGWWQWLAVAIAPAYIVVLMCFSANSGTARMAERHAGDPEWDAYRDSSGLLLPALGGSSSTTR